MGSNIKTPQRLKVEEFCRKYPPDKMGTKPLARLILQLNKSLFTRFPNEDKNLEYVRQMVKSVRGLSGDLLRSQTTSKELFVEPRYQYNKQDTYLQNKDSAQYKEAQKRKLSKSKYYLITWAQNNTPIHQEFFNNLIAYKDFLGAELHVILGKYKNPTSLRGISADEHWAKEVVPFADAHKHHLHKKLELLSDVRVQPTASLPLTGLEGISGLCSCVVGHPKVQLKVIAALEGYEPKIMLTTGAVTKRNYTDSKAGKKGEFHHTYGFTIIEIVDNEVFIPRQVTALANGSFTDMCYNVKGKKITKISNISFAKIGDRHNGDHCSEVERQQRKLLDYFKPKSTIIPDLFNGHSLNPHEQKDPIKLYEREVDNSNNFRKEIDEMLEYLKTMLKYNVVVESANHNDFADRYIKAQDWKRDIKNAKTYAECLSVMLSGKAPNGIIAYYINERFGNKVKTLGRNDSFRINEWELASHGDLGVSGSKGSIGQFKRLSTKMVLAHSHTPAREDGILYVGTSTRLRVGYNQGASSWMNCDVIGHLDKKAQHVFYMGKDKIFTTFKL